MSNYRMDVITSNAQPLDYSTIPQLLFDVPPPLMSHASLIPVAISIKLYNTSRTSNLRMFMFNVLSENNWCNAKFKQCVDMAFRILLVKMSMNPNILNVQPMMDAAIEDCLMMFGSQMYWDYPNLQNALPQLSAACTNNSNILQNYMMQADGLMRQFANQSMGPYPQPGMGGYPQPYPQNQPYYPQPVAQPMPQPMMVPRNMGNSPPPSMASYRQSYAHPSGGMRSPTGNQNPHQQHPQFDRFGRLHQENTERQNVIRQDYYFDRVEPPVPEPQNFYPEEDLYVPDEEHEEIVTRKDWVPTPEAPYRTLITTRQQRVYKRVNGVVIEFIEELPVDRQQHEGFIKVLGKKVPIDSIKHQRLYEDAKRLEAITGHEINQAMKDKRQEKHMTEELKVVKEYISPETLSTASLDNAIVLGQIEQYVMETEDNVNVFRAPVVNTIPVITGKTTDDEIIDEINVSKRFTQVSTLLKNAVDREIKKRSEDSGRKLDFYKEINAILTGMINDFLKYKLSLSINIDDFCEDVNELYPYIRSKFGEKYVQAYDEFELEMMGKGLFESLTEEGLQEAKQSLMSMSGRSSEVGISIIPVNYYMTFLGISNDEMKLRFVDEDNRSVNLIDQLTEEENGLLIVEDLTPVLYSLAKSSYEQADLLDSPTMHHLLITKDNVIYEFHKGYLMENAYLISLHR